MNFGFKIKKKLNLEPVADINSLSGLVLGDFALDSTDNNIKYYNGSSWSSITSDVGVIISPLTTKGDVFTRSTSVDTRLPVGTNGQVLVANSATTTGLEWQRPLDTFKTNPNFVINGNFAVAQRGTSGTVNNGGSYLSVDRWIGVCLGSGAELTVQQITASPPNSYTRLAARMTRNATSSTDAGLRQFIENGTKRFSGQTITVSYWTRCTTNANGQFFITINDVASPTITLPLQNTWYFVKHTFTIASGLSGNMYLDINRGIAPSTTFDVAQVKLELGNEATPFCLAGLTQHDELQLCYRYYETSFSPLAQTSTLNTYAIQAGSNSTGSQWYSYPVVFRVTKQTAPVVSMRDTTGAINRVDSIAQNGTTFTTGRETTSAEQINIFGFRAAYTNTQGTNRSGMRFHWVADAEITAP
jgi:hypothetical protein